MACLLVVAACQRDKPAPISEGNSAASGTTQPPAKISDSAQVDMPSDAGSVDASPADAAPPVQPPDAALDAGHKASNFELQELFDVGPAGPASAHESGVFMVTRDNRLRLAKRNGNHFAALEDEALEFRKYARAPGILAGYAYWVNGQELLRHPLKGEGPAQVLASNARHSTRVATPPDVPGMPNLVAYIAGPSGDPPELLSLLWVEKKASLRLSVEGAGAHSVALARAGNDLIAATLDAHLGMTPVSLRRIHLAKSGPKLDDNQIAWVGAGATSLTELLVLNTSNEQAWGLVGMQKDVTHFGLAQFPLSADAPTATEATWFDYQNGIDPAPVAGAAICGAPLLAFARPSSAKVRAPQELCLARFDPRRGVSDAEVIGTSRAFSDISMAPIAGGAVLTYVADRRTWARVVHCRQAGTP